jgi:hypothetical protein
MGVATEGQGDAVRDFREKVRFMGHVNDGGVIGDLCKGAGEIITAFKTPATSFLYGDDAGGARQPKRKIIFCKFRYFVLKDWNANVFEGALALGRSLANFLRRQIIPPIMITNDGKGSQR